MQFQIPEFSLNKAITCWSCPVNEVSNDLMQESRIHPLYCIHPLCFKQVVMTWEDNEVAAMPHGLLEETDVRQHIYHPHVEDLPIIKEAESHKMKLLDTGYSAVDFGTHCNRHKNLDLEARNVSYKNLSKNA
jgi:hypothetical protein